MNAILPNAPAKARISAHPEMLQCSRSADGVFMFGMANAAPAKLQRDH